MSITFSAGVAGLAGDEDTVDSMLARADAALYRAKVLGRNRVVAQEATEADTPASEVVETT